MNMALSIPLLASTAVQWALIIVALILLVIAIRFFAHILHFIMRFFWHGCGTIIIILIVWYLLHYFKLI
jgi:hypothetical protein